MSTNHTGDRPQIRLRHQIATKSTTYEETNRNHLKREKARSEQKEKGPEEETVKRISTKHNNRKSRDTSIIKFNV